MPKTIIQITDMHLFEDENTSLLGINTWESFQAVVNDVKSSYPQPDFILLTGDLAQDETIEAYEKLTKKLDIFHCPKYGIPGNHDDEEHMQTVFRSHHLQENREIIVDNINIILLNTQKANAVEGLLSESQLEFLNKSIGQYPEHHTFIFMHHPPVPVGSEWLDKWMLSNADAFWDVLAPYHHIQGIFCGHVHQEFTTQRNGIHIFTTPSTCFQFTRNSQKFGVEPLMPGYRVININDDGTIGTQVHRISNFNLKLDVSSGGY